uniref:Neprosin activation peptide domain-containing protein n=1 Tax=Ananas comosus var. bracteatus TaxID=296719 RepID=A0A6V7PJ48_ANACO|nr:unnamed protein product [Ananas comosus var. bracteatus]
MSPSPSTALLVLLLVFAAVVCNETTHASASNATANMGASPQKLERIQRYLEKINKPAVKSIKSPDGDIIDCVLMNKQLAFDHPLLKNHKIQRVAPNRPALRSEAANQQPRNETRAGLGRHGTMSKTAPTERCRYRERRWRMCCEPDLCLASSERKFLNELLASLTRAMSEYVLQYAVAYVNQQQAYGTKAIIDVWDPSVEFSSEFSLSQIWLVAGSYENEALKSQHRRSWMAGTRWEQRTQAIHLLDSEISLEKLF